MLAFPPATRKTAGIGAGGSKRMPDNASTERIAWTIILYIGPDCQLYL